MYRGTTPTLYLELDTELDLSNLAEMWVTFKSPTVEITKTLSEVAFDTETNVITVILSQNETLQLFNGKADVQVRLRTNDDLAYATDIVDVEIGRILKEGVI
jgi:hypothetical protein